MATEKKITKAMKFADLKSILNGETPVHGCSIDMLNEFIDNEVALLAKKNSADTKAKQAKSAENEVRMEKILNILSKGGKFSTTMLVKELNDPVNMTSQRVSYLLTQLVTDGKVEKTVEKRQSLYSIVA